MFLSDRLVFLQLQKSACTHVANLLMQRLDGRIVGKHEPLTSAPGDRLVVCSIRNPWDWYVSLWAFGCQHRGALYLHLTEPRYKVLPGVLRDGLYDRRLWRRWPDMISAYTTRDRKEWRSLYSDSGSAEAFRRWLTRILSADGKRFEGEDYPYLPMRDFIGLYTYRFLRLSSLQPVWRRNAPRLQTMESVMEFHSGHNVVDRYIRTETLEDDLAGVLREIGFGEVTADDLSTRRRNASSHRRTAHYYDEETIALVARQESFLIDRFGYVPPEPVEGAA